MRYIYTPYLPNSDRYAIKGSGYKRVRCNPIERLNRQQSNSKIQTRTPTLRKIKRAVSPNTSRHKSAHLILPERTQALPPPYTKRQLLINNHTDSCKNQNVDLYLTNDVK
jgi:hypothetical protein